MFQLLYTAPVSRAADSTFTCSYTTNSEMLFFNEACFEKLEGASSKASIEEIKHKRGWQKLEQSNPFIINHPNEVLWIRFPVENNANDSHKRFLEFPDAHNSNIQLFSILPSGKTIVYPAVGFDLPISQREYHYKNVLYDLSIPYGETQWFYARLESKYESSFLTMIVSDAYLLSYFLPEYYWLGLFYGILFIMAIYNLFIYTSTREHVYVYYVLYVFCCALYTGGEDTILFQLFWPDWPVLNHYCFVLSPPLLTFSYTLYSISFLEIKKEFRTLIYTCFASTALAFVCALIGLNIFYKVSTFLFYIPFLILYSIAITLYRRGKLFTRFFIIGSSFILVSLTVFLLRKLNILPSNIYTFYTFNFAFVVEVMLFSYALADKLKLIKRDKEETQNLLIDSLTVQEKLKDSINRELEKKVKERTHQLEQQSLELAYKNEQLQLMTNKLNEMNIKLDVDNWQLKKQVVEETKSRILLQEVSMDEFKEIFPDESSCYRFLEELKWESGFVCSKCGNHTYMASDKLFARKCKKCRYNESVTANTLFQGIKFPINKAFYITYRTFNDTDKITVEELSQLVSIRTATVWAFRKKVQETKEAKRKAKVKLTSWEQIIQ
ncbi:MAG: chromosome segregation ATPase [Chitinophagaceae bacterium]|nr:chromosome segregation ATPase [Chitinophagaceae bacterium]